MSKVLLSGVRGNLGRVCAATLLEIASPEDLIFTSSDETSLQAYADKGVDVRVADFNEPEGLEGVFASADTAILISMPFVGPRRRDAHKAAIDAAVAAGVKRIVYTSTVGAGEDDIDAYEVKDHIWTEKYILGQPVHYLFMRNSQYAEAMVASYLHSYENTGGVLANNQGDGKMAYISRDDCARAAAYAAVSDWNDRVVDVNGAELMTITDFVAIASDVTGKKVTYRAISDEEQYAFFDSVGVPRTTEEMWADTAKAFPFCSDGMVSYGRAVRNNQMSTFTDDFEKLVGHPPLTVRQIFEDIENHGIGERTVSE